MAVNLDLVGKAQDPVSFSYRVDDVILYALGVGATEQELDFVSELADLKVLPTYAVIPTQPVVFDLLSRLGVNLMTLVHGEQSIDLHRPLPIEGRVQTVGTVSHVYDKGKAALVHIDTHTADATGKALFDTRWTLFCRGDGGFGGERGPEAERHDPPEGTPPTFADRMRTASTQALLYRLSGDRNPIHADPGFAAMAGFPKPILHGLCTFGHLGRAVVRHACGGDPARLRHLSGRFSGVVFPGETLICEGFGPAEGRDAGWVLRVRTEDGEKPVFTHGFARIG
jgi:acyl dehydratase